MTSRKGAHTCWFASVRNLTWLTRLLLSQSVVPHCCDPGRTTIFVLIVAPFSGQLSFRAFASNNSGVWNEKGASLDFSIAPAYYLCAADVLTLLWVAHRLRVQVLERHQTETQTSRTTLAYLISPQPSRRSTENRAAEPQ